MAAEPKPNYSLTKDKQDLRQLTDGKLTPYKAWTSKASVGWAHRTPIKLNAVITGEFPANRKPQLRLRTGKSVSAGVFPPRRVDVYCNNSEVPDWQPGGAYKQSADKHPDSQNIWLEINLADYCRNELRLIIHAEGRFVMLDEIEVRLTLDQDGRADSHSLSAYAEKDLIAESLYKLRSSIKKQHREQINRLLQGADTSSLSAWVLPAFDSLKVSDLSLAEMPAKLSAQFVPEGGDAAAVLAVVNAADDARQFELALDSDHISEHSRVFRIEPVLAIDGQMAYDALIPVHDITTLAAAPNTITFFYLQFNLIAGDGEISISIDDRNGRSKRMSVPIKTIARPGIEDNAEPRFFTWSYSSDLPVWSSLGNTATVDYLTDAGVNVFIVHPKFLPLPNQNDSWSSLEAAFLDEVSLYKDRGIILFFLAWDVKLANWKVNEAEKADAIGQWLKELVSRMELLGYSYDDWALYPIDEPHENKLRKLVDFASFVDAADNRVQLYANPIWNHRDLLLTKRIKQLFPYVDIWQPRAGKMAELIGEVLPDSSRAEFWIYDNPKEPAKSASPSCYRYFAWRAIDVGATGFGFWSFSDTGNSSAWDDFDGQRADWAVVYEGDTELVSSRRWEAAKTGAREFGFARQCVIEANRAAGDQSSVLCRAYVDTIRLSANTDGCAE